MMNFARTTWANALSSVAACIFAFVWMPTNALAEPCDLICCGADEVFVIDPGQPELKKWSWRAEQSSSIPVDFHNRFRSTDDCKPYGDGMLLITSSSGGVALIDRTTKECQFLAESKNAHSACLLPNRQIAVASSFGGDQLQFYHRDEQQKPATVGLSIPVQAIPLLGAHGTVWDTRRKCLWALGEKELLALVATAEATPQKRWKVHSRTALPSNGGHDLSPQRDGEHLFVTTDTQVLAFDCDKLSFKVADGIGDQAKIKSVDRHLESGRIVYHQATAEHWWSEVIRFLDDEKLTLTGERLYKVRWDVPAPSA